MAAKDDNGSLQQERYIHDHESETYRQDIGKRTSANEAAFFLPYLRPGMSLLDCGAGPGTITVGLAQRISPGRAVGIDISGSEIERAKVHAQRLSVFNVRFEVANIYELPFPNDSFDAVYIHAILGHLSKPAQALLEVYRVLKPNVGVVGAREVDVSGDLVAPHNADADQLRELFLKVWQLDGGNPYLGSSLRGLLRQAGFKSTKASASYSYWGTDEANMASLEIATNIYKSPGFVEPAIKSGWADESEIRKGIAALEERIRDPDAFYAQAWCEVVGWKE